MRPGGRFALALVAALSLTEVAAADALGPNTRGLAYSFRIDNLAEYPDHAFILYPTSNAGFGYVLEPGVELTQMMTWERRDGPTRLWAMTREALRRHHPDAPRHPHGDHGEQVTVVRPPPASTPVAATPIHPPGTVPLDDPRAGVERTFHIVRVTDRELVLERVEEVTRMRDGTRVVRRGDGATGAEAAPEGYVGVPAADVVGGCSCRAGAVAAPGAIAWLAIIGLMLRRRGRSHRRA